jgi:hypothetical protein
MLSEFFDRVSKITDAAFDKPATEYGKACKDSQESADQAWIDAGVDPKSDLLREPYVRNDGASRVERGTGFWFGGRISKDFPKVPDGWDHGDVPQMYGGGGVANQPMIQEVSTSQIIHDLENWQIVVGLLVFGIILLSCMITYELM